MYKTQAKRNENGSDEAEIKKKRRKPKRSCDTSKDFDLIYINSHKFQLFNSTMFRRTIRTYFQKISIILTT